MNVAGREKDSRKVILYGGRLFIRMCSGARDSLWSIEYGVRCMEVISASFPKPPTSECFSVYLFFNTNRKTDGKYSGGRMQCLIIKYTRGALRLIYPWTSGGQEGVGATRPLQTDPKQKNLII